MDVLNWIVAAGGWSWARGFFVFLCLCVVCQTLCVLFGAIGEFFKRRSE